MRMHAEAARRRDAIVVQHAQRAEMHVLRIAIVGERKAVMGIEPAMIGVAAIARAADLEHRASH
ncbi:hypothetical protein DM50_3077 [Burkholderia mallei]|nr:hypothetical protein DM50_3077 [Burkholderia mallei]